ncbi:MAG: hypothetical protein QGG88_03210 [Gammaproteobacteria bacterium]|nr:hypothetical protein [Gammaproteobacteria bacterium]
MKKKVWHPVIGHPEIRFGQYIVPNFVSNSVAIQVDKQEFVIVSPGAPLLSDWPAQWRTSETMIHIIMPNCFHYMGVEKWRTEFPNHALYTSKAAIPVLIKKGVVKDAQEIHALEDKSPPLPDGYSILFPPGHRGSDVWFKKYNKQTKTSLWITCDSFLNYEKVSNQPIARAMQKLLGAAPGLKISQVIKWLLLDDKKSFKNWVLVQIAKDKPTTLIPGHGEIAQNENLPDQLQALILNRL